MNFAIILVIIIVVLALIFTVLLAGKGDETYRQDTKRNATNLTAIYTIVILLSLIAVAIYIRWYV
ncbi:hypothetical protein M3182_17305 [Mesobacillus maritimus]|uniref:hypothetical protein n=1 Tax=Mesobacillus maritimus TaxID=1643336 RepID=UPI00203DBD3A|nr:hypothetical protein [Mesobacillus maritimus]MCM3587496.1 hypothetical protein [Mesobacillus maritimus]MCM3671143.1 hypothetical protein [Mesobacillus maritimus]